MKILIVGSGGREHTIGWRLAQGGNQIIAMPGNPGLAQVGRCVDGDVCDLATTVELAKEHRVDLIVIGPEAPLCLGLADALRAEGFDVFGPGKEAARLEGSKIYSKEFFERHGIKTAPFVVCENMQDVDRALKQLGHDVVVKADGLAGGKGVFICSSENDVRESAKTLFEGQRFGAAGEKILIEKKILGRELSVMALCDGKSVRLLPGAEDHKTIFEKDEGPNTGGMGTVSPPSWSKPELIARIKKDVFDKTVAGLQKDGLDFRGVLFAGLMVDSDGCPWLLEYNVRFGDPETQAVFARWRGDVAHWLLGTAQGELPEGEPLWDERTAVCVVMAAKGYPGTNVSKGDEIKGLKSVKDAMVFHAGTRQADDKVLTSGGRVLGVCALAGNVDNARALVYEGVGQISFSGAQYRKDIGLRES